MKYKTVNIDGYDVPIVPKLATRILEILQSGRGRLNMAEFHTCETTHCIAGWALTIAYSAGQLSLVDSDGWPARVADRVFQAAGYSQQLDSLSRSPSGDVPRPSFSVFVDQEEAIDQLALCAAMEATGDVVPMEPTK